MAMKQRDMEIILGFVVFVALVSLVLGVTWLSSRLNIRTGSYRIHIVFDDIGGLHRGDHVNVGGLQVGKVIETELHNGKPSAYASIWGFPKGLPDDSRFGLKSESLLGGFVVDIEIGDSPEMIETESYVKGRTSAGFESLAPELSRLTGRLVDPNTGMFSDKSIRRIHSTFASLDSATASLHKILSESRDPLGTILDSLDGATGDAKGLIGESRRDVKQILEAFAKTSSRLDSVTSELGAATGSMRRTSENLRAITEKIRQGDGTLGKLVHDEKLYEGLRNTLAGLDSLLVDIKKNPKRYFDFSVF